MLTYKSRPHIFWQGSEQKVAPMQQTHTWAQIVKKEPSTNTNGKLKETEVPESTTSSVKNQKPNGKGSSQSVKAEQSGSGRKRSKYNLVQALYDFLCVVCLFIILLLPKELSYILLSIFFY